MRQELMEEEHPKNRSDPLDSKRLTIIVSCQKGIEDRYDECISTAAKEKSLTVRKRPEKPFLLAF
jgi:hypothetical protein